MPTPPPQHHPAQDDTQDDVRYHGYHHGSSGAGMIAVEDAEGNTIGVVRHVVVDSPTGLSWGFVGAGPADTARSVLLAALDEDAHHRAGCHQHGPDRVYGLRSGLPAPSLPALHDRPRGQLGRAVVHHPTTGSGLARRPPSRLTQTSYARNPQPHPWRSHGLCSGHPPSCRHHIGRIHTHSLPILAPCMWLLATCRWFS